MLSTTGRDGVRRLGEQVLKPDLHLARVDLELLRQLVPHRKGGEGVGREDRLQDGLRLLRGRPARSALLRHPAELLAALRPHRAARHAAGRPRQPLAGVSSAPFPGAHRSASRQGF